MDCLGRIRVNSSKTGKLLYVKEVVFEDEEAESYEEFCKLHGKDINEYLINLLPKKYKDGYLFRIDLIELQDEEEEDATDEDEEEEEDSEEMDEFEPLKYVHIRRGTDEEDDE